MPGSPPQICTWVSYPKSTSCGKAGEHRVEVHNKTTHIETWLCKKHFAMHNSFAAAHRAASRQDVPITGGSR